ncbi:MAG: S8 family serine peptidase [Patescibacteria group bacterium]
MLFRRLKNSFLFCILIGGIFLISNFCYAQDFVENEVIIKFKDVNEKQIELFNKSIGANVKEDIEDFKLLELNLNQEIEYIENNSIVEFVQPNYIYEIKAQITPWGINNDEGVKASAAWNKGYTGDGIKVGILDTGINYNHTDLDANMYAFPGDSCIVNGSPVSCPNYGYDFVGSNDNDPQDDHWHGTHVAGIVGAENNNQDVVGVAPDVELVAIKVLNAGGSGTTVDIIEGINFARENDLDVINFSLGGYSWDQSLQTAITNSYNDGIVIVCAAGNESENMMLYPAGFEETISVGSINQTDSVVNPDEDMGTRLSYFSNIGNVDVVAPGGLIYSTYRTGSYVGASGTSMAAPHVSGLAALILEKNSNLTPLQVKQILESTAVDLGVDGRDQFFGSGLIDANSATANVANSIILSANYPESGNLNLPVVPSDSESTISIKASLIDSNQEVNFSTTAGEFTTTSTVTTDSNGEAEIELQADSVPQTATITATATGYGEASILIEMVDVLLVTDAYEWYNQNNLAWFSEQALNENGIKYLRYDTRSGTYPSSDYLNKFNIIIWYTGERVLATEAQTIIQDYLDNNGKVFINGQDIGYSIDYGSASNIILGNYLKASYVGNDGGSALTGDDIFLGLDLTLTDRDYNSGLDADEISVLEGGTSLAEFSESGNSAGVKVDNGYRSIFLPFGLNSVLLKENRENIFSAIFDFLNPLEVPSEIHVSDGDENAEDIVNSKNEDSALLNIAFFEIPESGYIHVAITDGENNDEIWATADTTDLVTTVSDVGFSSFNDGEITLTTQLTDNLNSLDKDTISHTITKITVAPSSPPTNIISKFRKPKRIKIKWTEPGDELATSYIVKVGTKKKNWDVGEYTATKKNRVIRRLKTNKKYYFKVAAVNGEGQSSFSKRKNLRTKPKKVKGLKSTKITENTAKLKWKKPRGKIKNYKVRIYKKKKLVRKYRIKKKELNLINLKDKTLYRYKVRAVFNRKNKGSWSNRKSFITL